MNEPIQVKHGIELGDTIRMKMSWIFVEGFHQWLKFFSKDKEKLVKTFSHIFNLDVFYIAVEGDLIVGIAACTDSRIPSVRLDKGEFQKHLGFLKGFIAYKVLKKEFEEKKYPFPISDEMGMIEFVATSPDYRGKGVATAIFQHIFSTADVDSYVLEVADTNIKAVSLYEKLGFSEFMRIAQKNPKQSGVNNLIYMRCQKSDH